MRSPRKYLIPDKFSATCRRERVGVGREVEILTSLNLNSLETPAQRRSWPENGPKCHVVVMLRFI
jgi:hypothetical protein